MSTPRKEIQANSSDLMQQAFKSFVEMHGGEEKFVEDLKKMKIHELFEKIAGTENMTLHDVLERANTEQTGLDKVLMQMPVTEIQSLLSRGNRRRPTATAMGAGKERAARGERLVPVLKALKGDIQGVRRGDLEEKVGFNPTIQITHAERQGLVTRTGTRGKFRYKLTPQGEEYLAKVA